MTLRFGKVKVYAQRLARGEPIPVFRSRRDNLAIDEQARRILAVKTRQRRPGR